MQSRASTTWRDSSSGEVAARGKGFASIPLDLCGEAVPEGRYQREIVPGLGAPFERYNEDAPRSGIVSCACRIGIKEMTSMH
jgi:hypothetical protein